MPRMAQFILALLLGLALLVWAASGVVQTTAREWFERDVSSRAQLVLVGASQSLANSWYGPQGSPKAIGGPRARRTRDGCGGLRRRLEPAIQHPGIPGRI